MQCIMQRCQTRLGRTTNSIIMNARYEMFKEAIKSRSGGRGLVLRVDPRVSALLSFEESRKVTEIDPRVKKIIDRLIHLFILQTDVPSPFDTVAEHVLVNCFSAQMFKDARLRELVNFVLKDDIRTFKEFNRSSAKPFSSQNEFYIELRTLIKAAFPAEIDRNLNTKGLAKKAASFLSLGLEFMFSHRKTLKVKTESARYALMADALSAAFAAQGKDPKIYREMIKMIVDLHGFYTDHKVIYGYDFGDNVTSFVFENCFLENAYSLSTDSDSFSDFRKAYVLLTSSIPYRTPNREQLCKALDFFVTLYCISTRGFTE